MPITHLSYQGKSWPKDKFVAACLNGDCAFPAPVAATIIRNMADYNNHNTVSGSQLHSPCDYQRLLDRLAHTVDITTLFYATYRGSNVHAMIETCKIDPAFAEWMFEKRFFATLGQDDKLCVLHVPMTGGCSCSDGSEGSLAYIDPDCATHGIGIEEPDWEAFNRICDDLRASGHIILSGALDAFEPKKGKIRDWKTAKIVGKWTDVKESWQQQMNCYTVLARVNGHRVTEVEITVFDAADIVILQVPPVDEVVWIPAYFIPRVRKLALYQSFTVADIVAVNEGMVEPPKGFPLPVVNYLCNGENLEHKIYCAFRTNGMCPAWRNAEVINTVVV